MIRRIVRALILVPLAVILVAFAVANRHGVTVSFDPFNQVNPAFALTMPLFVLIIVLAIVGVIVGGTAAWFGQNKWRRAARQHERDASRLAMELDAFRARSGEVRTGLPAVARAPRSPRLKVPPAA